MASSSSLALSTLLSTLHTHLNTQTQLLPQLHSRLGLPATALEDELQELQQNLTRAVESQVELRKKQVEEWMTKCEEVEAECSRYACALGTHAKVAGSLNEIKSEKVLPQRHQRALEYQERLRQVYHTKLEQLTALTNRLSTLARSLGSSYFSADVLRPTASAEEEPSNPNALRDVMPERFSKLEKELVRGKGEMTKRLALLGDVFLQIDWLYTELGTEPPETGGTLPVASSSTLSVPSYPLPRSSSSNQRQSSADPFLEPSNTPTPSSQSRSDAKPLFRSASPTLGSSPSEDPGREFRQAFSRFVQLLDTSLVPDPVPVTLLSSLGIEPTQRMMLYAEQQCSELTELKKRRETHIQAMYDQLESLWRRMGVDNAAMDAFVEANRGTTPQVIQAYEEELERMIDLKRERMAEFIWNARTEIESLWDELLTGEDERADFAAFVDDEHTEDLLSQHEHEIARLQTEVRSKTPLLASIKKYFDICEEEKELERAAGDQTRLLGRGAGGSRDPGRLLREEKMRKRVGKEKPKLEQQLLSSLPKWEQANGRPFLVHGESMLRLLMANVSANEQENRKKTVVSQYSVQAFNTGKSISNGLLTRSRSLEPTTGNNMGKVGYVPGKMHNPPAGAVTPAIRSGSSMSQTTTKRQKLADGRAKPMRSSSPEKEMLPKPNVQVTTRPKHAEGYASLGWGRVPSTAQRTTSRAATTSSVTMRRHVSSIKSQGTVTMNGGRTTSLDKGTSSRIRRESFRPRPSIDGLRSGATAYRGMPPTEEE